MRLDVISFLSQWLLRKSSRNIIFPVFLQQNTIRYIVLPKVLTKYYKTHDYGMWHFLPAKHWFGNALPKAMKTCFKAILQIKAHRVGGICDNSRRKIIRLNLTATCKKKLEKSFAFEVKSYKHMIVPAQQRSQSSERIFCCFKLFYAFAASLFLWFVLQSEFFFLFYLQRSSSQLFIPDLPGGNFASLVVVAK